MSKIVIPNATTLATSAEKFRSDILKVAVHRLEESLKHFTPRYGVRYKETVGELSGDVQIGPYSEIRVDNDDIAIIPRTLETFFGSVIKPFSPNSVYQTIYGSDITKGDALQTTDIAYEILSFMMAKIGANLDLHIFDAVRDDTGTGTKDLFNGFDTIADSEITAGNISTTLGNLYDFSEAITKNNAYDAITAFCEGADELLTGRGPVNLYLPTDVYRAYLADYKATTGLVPYNTKYEKIVVEGFENVNFVPMYQKRGSRFMQLSPKSNMLVGMNMRGEEETVDVTRHDLVLHFIATLFFGTQYESIDKTRLLIGRLPGDEQEKPSEPEGGDDENKDNNNVQS